MNKTKPYYIFNGDADGICATHQFYRHKPIDFTPVTGTKRDISLLKKIDADRAGNLFVFDIAVEQNLVELHKLLGKNFVVYWFDHHISEQIPSHSNFSPHIDTNPLVNTSYIVARFLNKPSLWAVIGLCGDNILQTAKSLATDLCLSFDQFEQLKEMGELLNYNGYGGGIEDLHFHPADILVSMRPFACPFDYLRESTVISDLREGMKSDLLKTECAVEISDGIYKFPDAKWARRTVGVFANRKISEKPNQACAVLIEKKDGKSAVVSVRSPLNSAKNAAKLCKEFPTGGGRIKAAGINFLPIDRLSYFIDRFKTFYS